MGEERRWCVVRVFVLTIQMGRFETSKVPLSVLSKRLNGSPSRDLSTRIQVPLTTDR